MKVKYKYLILLMLIFSFSISYGANGDEEFKKGNSYIVVKKYNEAEKYLLEAAKKGNIQAYNALGYLYFVRDEFEKSEYYLLKGLEYTKDEKLKKKVKLDLAYIYIKQNKEKEAEKLLRSIKNNDATVFNTLGILYYNNQNYKKAIEYYKKALDKGNDISISNLVISYSEIEEANDEIRELVNKEYKRGNIYAYGFYGIAKIYDEGAEEGKKICELGIKKGDPNSYLCMSVFYEKKGNKIKSKELFEKYKVEMGKLEDKLEKNEK